MKQRLHVGQGVDGDTATAYFAVREGMVRVVTEEGRIIKSYG